MILTVSFFSQTSCTYQQKSADSMHYKHFNYLSPYFKNLTLAWPQMLSLKFFSIRHLYVALANLNSLSLTNFK